MELLVARLAVAEKYHFALTAALLGSLEDINNLTKDEALHEISQKIEGALIAVDDENLYSSIKEIANRIPDFDSYLQDWKNNNSLIEMLQKDLLINLRKKRLCFEVLRLNTEDDKSFDQLNDGDYTVQFTPQHFLADFKALVEHEESLKSLSTAITDLEKKEIFFNFNKSTEIYRNEFFGDEDLYLSEFKRLVPVEALPEFKQHKSAQFSKILANCLSADALNEQLTTFIKDKIVHLVRYSE